MPMGSSKSKDTPVTSFTTCLKCHEVTLCHRCMYFCIAHCCLCVKGAFPGMGTKRNSVVSTSSSTSGLSSSSKKVTPAHSLSAYSPSTF
ncbi:hypothetical protein MVEG_07890 [Podila verticillata NRRL 6337]|nr:hypothetical protein MVEG_07890 [Podila verticillata NRRL 6337]